MEQPEEPLTYATATPEQIAQARENARRKLREARERMTPERWQELREFIAGASASSSTTSTVESPDASKVSRRPGGDEGT